jgi:hypothetical protein
MSDLDRTLVRLRLDGALNGLAITFKGMTACPDEQNCECHWGSAADLALLKVPDVELGPDLLRRTWQAADWLDHASVLRRILPQLATAVVNGLVEPFFGMEEVGQSFARGQWQQWPADQAAAVREFLTAWWIHALTDPSPAAHAYEILPMVAEASGSVGPWLDIWETLADPVADRHLVEAVAHWDYDLLADELPWSAFEDKEGKRAELTSWLVHHAAACLRRHGVLEELLHRIRLLGLTGPARWYDPHWPGYQY